MTLTAISCVDHKLFTFSGPTVSFYMKSTKWGKMDTATIYNAEFAPGLEIGLPFSFLVLIDVQSSL